MQSFMRIGPVMERTGLTRSTLYAKIKEGSFPRQINLGVRSSAWITSEVEEWIAQRIASGRRHAGAEQLRASAQDMAPELR